MAMIAVAFIVPTSVMAWTPPTVTPLCAPDTDHYAFTVNLDTNTWDNSGYSFDWAFGATQPESGWTTVPANVGDNKLVVARGEGSLWIRWTADASSVGSATPNGELCSKPSSDPSTSPSHHATPTPKSSPSGSVLGATGTPQITPPSTDAIGGSSDSSAGAGLRLLLIATAGILAALMLITPSRRRSRSRR
jgi:hypothetical protein